LDKITKGFLAGTAGGFTMSVIDLILYYIIRFDDELYLEWGSIVVFGRLPENIGEMIIGQLSKIAFAGFLGVIYFLIMRSQKVKVNLINGTIYGTFSWFIIYGISILFRVPYLTTHSFEAVIATFIGAVTYGVTLAATVKQLNDDSDFIQN